MKIRKLIILILITAFILPAYPGYTAYDDVDFSIQNNCAKTIARLSIMLGDSHGNLMLENKITRAEFVTLVIRMMGYDRNDNSSSIALNFSDSSALPSWAVNYVKIALKHALIKGYTTDNTLRPNNNITYAEAQTVLLRALGYGENITGKWPENVLNISYALGINKNIFLNADHELTRGETSVLIYNCLTLELK